MKTMTALKFFMAMIALSSLIVSGQDTEDTGDKLAVTKNPSPSGNDLAQLTYCPSSAPLHCNGYSYEFCCPYGLGGSTSVCCNSQNSCTCPQTGFCPYKNQCCTYSNPLMCTGSNGREYCCPYNSNGSSNVCCSATNRCTFEGQCCPASAPLFCGSPGHRFCCPYGYGGSTRVCCSNSCTKIGICLFGNGLLGQIDKVLGPAEPQPETDKTHKSSLRVGVDNLKVGEIGLAALVGSDGDGRGKEAQNAPIGGK